MLRWQYLNQVDRYVFLGQRINEQKQGELIAIATFSEVSMTAEKVFLCITELCGPLIN